MQKNIMKISIFVGVLVLFAWVIAPSVKVNPEHVFPQNTIAKGNKIVLDTTRQVRNIKMDSLKILLNHLKSKVNFPLDAALFDANDKMTLQTTNDDVNIKRFNDAILRAKSLKTWEQVEGNFLQPVQNAYGFSCDIKKSSEVRYVQLPTDILQSMIIFVENPIK